MRTSDQSYKKSEIGRISKKITLSSLSVLAIAMQPSWSTINLSMSGFLFLFFVLFFFSFVQPVHVRVADAATELLLEEHQNVLSNLQLFTLSKRSI